MNSYEKILNTITLGGYFLWNIENYLKKRDDELQKRREEINLLIEEQKELSKVFNLVRKKLNS